MTTKVVPLKRLARVRYGLGQPPRAAMDGIPIIRATNILRGRISPVGLTYAALDDLPLDRAPLLEAGEVLVVRSGAYTGDSALVTEEWEGAAPGYDLRLTPNMSTDPRFLSYLLLSSPVLHQIDLVRSRAAQPHLNAEELGEIEVPIPAPEEQRAIAHLLDRETARIDASIESSESLRFLLLERRRGVVFRGVTGTMRGEDFHDPGLPWTREVRAPWPAVKIKHVARLGSGHTPSRARPEWWENPTIPWITTGEIQQIRSDRAEIITETREKISEIGLRNSAAELHPEGTVVLCRTASAGYSAIMGSDMATSQDFATWTCSERLLPRYLLMCLRAMRADLVGRLAFGSTHKTIYMPDIEALEIPLPSVDEQRKLLVEIDDRLGKIDVLDDRVKERIARLRERRLALITVAVSGQTKRAGATG